VPHKSEDLKISVIEHYLDSNKTQEVCNVFKCFVRSLMRWVFNFKYIVFIVIKQDFFRKSCFMTIYIYIYIYISHII